MHLLGLLNQVPTLIGWGKGEHVTSARLQVTLCHSIWHVSSCSSWLQTALLNLSVHCCAFSALTLLVG